MKCGFIVNLNAFTNQTQPTQSRPIFPSPGLLMAMGVGVYPNGWNSPEVQQACGHSSRAYNLGKNTLVSRDKYKNRKSDKACYSNNNGAIVLYNTVGMDRSATVNHDHL